MSLENLTREELIKLVLKQHETILGNEETIHLLQERVGLLEEEVAQLKGKLGGGGSAVPEWVKPNRRERREQERAERKKRKQSFVRHRERPTEVHEHAIERCPDCGRKLSGGWVHRRRQVIEIPLERVRIIEHQVISRKCGACKKVWTPKLSLSDEVVGQHRVGIGLMSLVAHLAIEGRMPLEAIQTLLKRLYRLHLGKGELSEILHTVARFGQGEYEKLKEDVRGSPVVSADETGWREDGMNGYIWSFSTPRVRYFLYRRSRGSDVPREVLGEKFGGVVACDFYGGYSPLDVERQRCWVHFLRDLKKVEEEHCEREDVVQWARKVRGVYRRAKQFRSDLARLRVKAKMRFERELLDLAEPYLGGNAPQRLLAQRIEKFIPELFVFVEHPEVPSENNAAERAVRPSVIARKISGGSRSPKGSATRMTLMSLFGTWKLRGLDTMEQCRQMLLNSG